MEATILDSLTDIPAPEWEAVACPEPGRPIDPFTTHRFLSALDRSHSTGKGTGWQPKPLILRQNGRLLAAMPLYVKSHSQGEYIFDHGWAEALERAGGSYYPKLQVAVPFTPCPGRRLLGEDRAALLGALEAVTVQNGLSSAHVTFLDEGDAAAAEARGWLLREGLQFHWFNRDYAKFDDFLAALSSRKRKAIRKERAGACEGLEVVTLRGNQIQPDHWAAMWRFYQDTGARKWGQPYLTRAFFDQVGEAMGDAALLFLALEGGTPVAGALNFVGADTLYGRYWGSDAERRHLHFELSYYRAIDWAIEHGLSTVQAGAQGEHKLARGYEPVLTRSAHFLPDAGFRQAVATFLKGERAAVRQELEWAREALPYRASDSA